GIKIVRRDENLESMGLRGLEDALHILDGVVFLKAFADQGPREPFFAQDFVLRIDEDNRGVVPMNVHSYLLFKFSVGRNRFETDLGLYQKESMDKVVLLEKSFD